MGDKGNLLGDKGFQFTRVPAAFIDTQGNWRPEKVETPTKVRNLWIYAIGYRQGDKGKLWGEYHADNKGALTFVSGDRRRAHEPAGCKNREKIRKPASPRSSKKSRSRTRSWRPAVNSRKTPSARWRTACLGSTDTGRPAYRSILNDPTIFVTDSSGVRFLPVVDVLYIGEELNRRYMAERFQAHAYVKRKPEDKSDITTGGRRDERSISSPS